jgi:hypothetical protein
MQKLILATLITCAGLLALSSCNDNTGGTSFKTKEDSINFAKSVMEIYPDSARPVIRRMARSMAADTVNPGMMPIPWDTLTNYVKAYNEDSRKLLNPNGKPYEGFTIDAEGYRLLLENADIQGLYLRLAKKADGSYTIIIMGTDGNGKPLQNSATPPSSGNSIFDNLRPCPDVCP